MLVNYHGDYTQIQLAIEDCNELLNSEAFFQQIKEHPGFNCSKKTPIEIAGLLLNSKLSIEVKLYKPQWLWSSVLGYFVESHPNTIFLNARKIYRESNSISNTIIHECIHALDYDTNNDIIEFGHNCGYFDKTAPYEIGMIAESIINGNQSKSNTILNELMPIVEERIL